MNRAFDSSVGRAEDCNGWDIWKRGAIAAEGIVEKACCRPCETASEAVTISRQKDLKAGDGRGQYPTR